MTVCVGFCRTTMKLMGKFRCSRILSLVRGLLPIPGSSRIVRNDGSDLLSRRDISIKLLSCNIFVNVCLILIYFWLALSYFIPKCLIRDLWSHQMSWNGWFNSQSNFR